MSDTLFLIVVPTLSDPLSELKPSVLQKRFLEARFVTVITLRQDGTMWSTSTYDDNGILDSQSVKATSANLRRIIERSRPSILVISDDLFERVTSEARAYRLEIKLPNS